MRPDWQRDINQTLGKGYNWEPFAKGSSNSLYRGCINNHKTSHLHQDKSGIDNKGGELVSDLIGDSNLSDQEGCILLRQNAPTELTPGVDRQREAALLELISNHHWAPNIIQNHPVNGWCAMVLYQPIPTNHTLTEAQQSQLIQAVNQLQQITTNTYLTDQQIELLNVDYDELWDTTYLPQAQSRNDQITLDWIDDIKQSLRTLPEAPLSLVHHDLHMGNLALKPYIQDSQQRQYQLIILDWEYGGLGNPWLDAAALVNFFKLSPQIIATLPAFKHLTPDTFKQGLKQAIEIRDLINKLWYRARGDL